MIKFWSVSMIIVLTCSGMGVWAYSDSNLIEGTISVSVALHGPEEEIKNSNYYLHIDGECVDTKTYHHYLEYQGSVYLRASASADEPHEVWVSDDYGHVSSETEMEVGFQERETILVDLGNISKLLIKVYEDDKIIYSDYYDLYVDDKFVSQGHPRGVYSQTAFAEYKKTHDITIVHDGQLISNDYFIGEYYQIIEIYI